MRHTYLIVHKINLLRSSVNKYQFIVPLDDTNSNVCFTSKNDHLCCIDSFSSEKLTEIDHITELAIEVNEVLENFRNQYGDIVTTNIKRYFTSKDGFTRLPYFKTNRLQQVAPLIVSAKDMKEKRIKTKCNNEHVFFSFDDSIDDKAVIRKILDGLFSWKKSATDGFAIFKDGTLLHSTITNFNSNKPISKPVSNINLFDDLVTIGLWN